MSLTLAETTELYVHSLRRNGCDPLECRRLHARLSAYCLNSIGNKPLHSLSRYDITSAIDMNRISSCPINKEYEILYDIHKIVEFAKGRQIVPDTFDIFSDQFVKTKVKNGNLSLPAMDELKTLVKIMANDEATSSRATLLSIFTLSSAQEAAMARRVDFLKNGYWYSRHYRNNICQKYRIWPQKMELQLKSWAMDEEFLFTSGRGRAPISGSALRMRTKLLGFSGFNYRTIHALFSRWARAQEDVGSLPLPYLCEGLIDAEMISNKDIRLMNNWYEFLINDD